MVFNIKKGEFKICNLFIYLYLKIQMLKYGLIYF